MCSLCEKYGTTQITDKELLAKALEDAAKMLEKVKDTSHVLAFIDDVLDGGDHEEDEA